MMWCHVVIGRAAPSMEPERRWHCFQPLRALRLVTAASAPPATSDKSQVNLYVFNVVSNALMMSNTAFFRRALG